MNDLEAAELAHRIVGGWPSRSAIPADEWASELRTLDPGAAGTAFVRLRRERVTPPSVYEFLRTYRDVRSSIDGPRPLQECDECGGAGWVETSSLIRGAPDNEQTYSQVRPCDRCDAGRPARAVHERIVQSATALASARLGPPLSTLALPPAPPRPKPDEDA